MHLDFLIIPDTGRHVISINSLTLNSFKCIHKFSRVTPKYIIVRVLEKHYIHTKQLAEFLQLLYNLKLKFLVFLLFEESSYLDES